MTVLYNMPKIKKPLRDAQALRVSNWMILGFKDYIAARTLLTREHLELQGASLASTAIEKYFKAIVAFRGMNSGGHLNRALINSVRNSDPGLFRLFNSSFLEMLKKCYQLRYLDKVKPGFNLVISRRKVLAELDFTVSEIQKRIKIGHGEREIDSLYQAYLKTKDPLICADNYLLQGIPKKNFIEEEDSVYEMRLLSGPPGVLEAFYRIKGGRDDGEFLKEGLVPGTTKIPA
jgi:hypothetical protein